MIDRGLWQSCIDGCFPTPEFRISRQSQNKNKKTPICCSHTPGPCRKGCFRLTKWPVLLATPPASHPSVRRIMLDIFGSRPFLASFTRPCPLCCALMSNGACTDGTTFFSLSRQPCTWARRPPSLMGCGMALVKVVCWPQMGPCRWQDGYVITSFPRTMYAGCS